MINPNFAKFVFNTAVHRLSGIVPLQHLQENPQSQTLNDVRTIYGQDSNHPSSVQRLFPEVDNADKANALQRVAYNMGLLGIKPEMPRELRLLIQDAVDEAVRSMMYCVDLIPFTGKKMFEISADERDEYYDRHAKME